ncbi:DUF2752 domain-containing protein [Pilimelia columellifera]|uniref:DUF2752 domain-containing protein n=1 Tax=Pilimelia columellifera TaxID=706574 RepID=UPI0031D326A4
MSESTVAAPAQAPHPPTGGRAPYGSPPHLDPHFPYAPQGRLAGWTARLSARAPRWLAPAGALACFGGAVAYVLVSDPTDSRADALPSCLLKFTTGLDCPGCGGTRAFYYLVQGNVPAAARHHALFVFAVPFLLYLYAAWATRAVFGRQLPTPTFGPRALAITLAVTAVFSVARNLPWSPFSWMYV